MAVGIPSGAYGHPTHVSRETASMVPWVFLRVLTAASIPSVVSRHETRTSVRVCGGPIGRRVWRSVCAVRKG